MEPLGVPVYYDFASTLCYVAHRVMERTADRLASLGVALEWRPIDLVGITGWPRGAPVEGPRRDNALRVARELGVSVRMPRAWPDLRPAAAIALSLAGQPSETTWRERVYSALHEEGRDLEEPGALARLAREVGVDFDHSASAAALADLESETRRARDAEVNGVPTFMLNGWPIGGIQADSTMLDLLGRWAAKQRHRNEPASPEAGADC